MLSEPINSRFGSSDEFNDKDRFPVEALEDLIIPVLLTLVLGFILDYYVRARILVTAIEKKHRPGPNPGNWKLPANSGRVQ